MGDFIKGFEKFCQAVPLLAVFLTTPTSSAETLFKDSFDAAPYSDNALLPTGPDQISYGVWSLNNRGQGTVSTTPAAFLSPTRSLTLSCPENGDQAQAVARFVSNGLEVPTAQALAAKLAFNLPEANSNVVVAIRSKSDATLVSIGIHSGGTARVFFGDRAVDLGSIAPNTWYHLAFSLPADPGGSDTSEYSVTLQDAEGSEIGTVSGPLRDLSGPTEYRYLTIYQENTQNVPQTS